MASSTFSVVANHGSRRSRSTSVPENVAKVACSYTIESPAVPPDITGVWTFHVQKPTDAEPWGDDDRFTLAGRVWHWWADDDGIDGVVGEAARHHFPEALRLDQIEVWEVAPDLDGPTTYTTLGDDRYGDHGGLVAPQLAHLVGLRTALSSRRGRGRIYFPAVSEVEGLGAGVGYVTPLMQPRLARIASNLGVWIRGTDFFSEGWSLAVFSRVDGAAHNVLQYWVPNRIATQRRRATPAQDYAIYGLDGEPVP